MKLFDFTHFREWFDSSPTTSYLSEDIDPITAQADTSYQLRGEINYNGEFIHINRIEFTSTKESKHYRFIDITPDKLRISLEDTVDGDFFLDTAQYPAGGSDEEWFQLSVLQDVGRFTQKNLQDLLHIASKLP